MQNLNFLHSLEVAQKFAVAEPEIIMQSQQLYGVKRDFSVSFRPRPKLNNFLLTSQKKVKLKLSYYECKIRNRNRNKTRFEVFNFEKLWTFD